MKGLRETATAELIRLTDEGRKVLMLVSDSTTTSKAAPMKEKYPGKVVNVGIAEQNLIGISAGLSLEGFIPFTANAAPFLISRANEQVKTDICYSNSNVKMLGLNAGVGYGSLAGTHHAIDDISIMLGFGNVEIYSPSDPLETEQIIRYAVDHTGPVYIRMDSASYPDLHEADYTFQPGELDVLSDGGDLTVFATGSVVVEATEAGKLLREQGIDARIISVPSLNPLNREAVAAELSRRKPIITVEEHSIHGGLGSLIAGISGDTGSGARIKRLGIPAHNFSVAGPQKEIRAYYGFDAAGIARTAQEIIKVK